MNRRMLIWLLVVSLSVAFAEDPASKVEILPGPLIEFGDENTIPGTVFESRAGLTQDGMIQFVTVEQGAAGNDIRVRQHPYNSFGQGMTTRSLGEGSVYEVKGPQYDLDSVLFWAVDANSGFNIREYDYLESTDEWLDRLVSTTVSYNAVSADAGQVLGAIYLVVQNFDNDALEFSHRNPITGAYTHVATYMPGEIANVFDGATNVAVGINPMSLNAQLSFTYQTKAGNFNLGLFDPKDNSFDSINVDSFSLTKGANANLLLDDDGYYKGYYDRNGEAVIYTINKTSRQVIRLPIGSEPIGNNGFLANIAPVTTAA